MNKVAIVTVLLVALGAVSFSAAKRSDEFFRECLKSQVEAVSKVQTPASLKKACDYFFSLPHEEASKKKFETYIQAMKPEERETLTDDIISYGTILMESVEISAFMDELTEEEVQDYGVWVSKLDYNDPDFVKLQPFTLSALYFEIN